MDGSFPLAALFLAIGYFCGSIPFGLILAKAFGLGDIRKIGSGNIGATNALRTGNKLLAFLTLLGDIFKGTVPILLAWRYGSVATAEAAAIGAFAGHLFPVWLGFKGGKGVATYIGILLGFAPVGVIVFAIAWLGMALVFRYSSLAALTATLLVPIAYLALGNDQAAALTGLLSVVVWFKHKANISRLIHGNEGKIGAKG